MSERDSGGSELSGRRAIVTGAASGIGRATGELLLARGAEVLAVDLQRTPELEGLGERGAELITCDVTDPEQRRELVREAGDSDFLVNSAGVIRLPAIFEAEESEWDLVFGVNAKALFFLCQQLGRRLRPGGGIVNLSSVAARNPVNTETAVYAATKAAVLSITRSFAHALAAAEVRVNAVVPGLIETPMQDYVVDRIAAGRGTRDADLRSQRTAGVPLGRLGTAAECAETIVWLLSPQSSYLTGQAIAVDGGSTML